MRSRVLQAAAIVLAQRGARLCTVEDILAQAGVSRRTFYRFYQSKDEVMLALYRVGTEGLLAQCRAALANERDLRGRFERCVDAHLSNAAGLSRLIFVLGGEAQHHESPLFTRRKEVLGQMVALLLGAAERADPLAVQALVLSLEGLVRHVLESTDQGRATTPAALAPVKAVMVKLSAAVLPEQTR